MIQAEYQSQVKCPKRASIVSPKVSYKQRVDNHARAFNFIKLVLVVLFKVRIHLAGATIVLLNHGINVDAPNVCNEVDNLPEAVKGLLSVFCNAVLHESDETFLANLRTICFRGLEFSIELK